MGTAIGRNPVSIIVPCHRVLGADGRLTGYGSGFERKAWLLDHEKHGAAAPSERDAPVRKRALLRLDETGTWLQQPRDGSAKVMLQQSSTAEGGGLVSRVSSRIWVQRNTAICRLWV